MTMTLCLGLPSRPCSNLTEGTRCMRCTKALEVRRGSRQARGYDADHDRARRELERMLPAPCGYDACRILNRGDRWVAAHRRDGRPEYGWMVATPECNERAKRRTGGT